MKPFFILIAGCLTAMSVFAQNAVTVNVTLNGNQNREVIVDGKSYSSNEVANQGNSGMSTKSTVTITDLLPGQHNLQVVRLNPNNNRRTNVMQKTFNLRAGYDLDVVVNGNGTIQLTEKRIRNGGHHNTTVHTPMTATGFNTILQDVRRQYGNTSKVTALNNVFSNTANYFTTSQVYQLVRLVTGEDNRLQVLKSAYRTVTDSEKFSGLYSLLASTASRQEIAAYVRAYTPSGTVPSSTTGAYAVAMTNANYNLLTTQIRNEYDANARITAIYNAFSAPNNYFTTEQARRLIQLTTGETNMLYLAKASYRSIIDKNNFTSIYNLIPTQAGKNDLALYVNTYSQTGNVPTSNPGTYVVAMSNANYNQLATQIQNQYDANARVAAIYNAFSLPSNYFTTEQARRLIQLTTGEATMLHLAKASYRSITDKNNFTSIYNLIPTQAGRNDLAVYVNNYNPAVVYNGSIPGAPATGVYKTPMSDGDFAALQNKIRGQWLPGAKRTAVISAFSTGDFFTTAQALQLIQLDSHEADRLEMAKASYKTISDPANFSQVYSLFTTSVYRDELAQFVTNYNSGAVSGAPATTGYNTAMSDVNFSNLLNSIRGQWLPGAKKSAVLNAFASADYFTTSQAMQLIQLDSDEDDRLDMAKASYRKVVDPVNFPQVYSLFSTPSFREALVAYVNANR